MQNTMYYNNQNLDLSVPRVMGILNVTPNSFSDGGCFLSLEMALKQARRMIQDGADIIDIGGESTRPGATPVAQQEEMDRVVPVIQALHAEFPILLSCDTSKTAVMAEAIDAGAFMINDVTALADTGAEALAAKTGVVVCLMHMKGKPETMQDKPDYSDVLKEVFSFLEQRLQSCLASGIKKDNIIIDPGFGFGKTLEHNLYLLKHIDQFNRLAPVLIGVSRKSMLGQITGRDVDERLSAGLAAACYAAMHNAKIIRVHDVRETVDALSVIKMITGI